jgi:hypothetical protein
MVYKISDTSVITAPDNVVFYDIIVDVHQDFSSQRPSIGYSATFAYVLGGRDAPGTQLDNIMRYPFSTDTNAADVGNLSDGIDSGTGNGSSTHGYHSGGRPTPTTNTANIEKFGFSSSVSTSSVGVLTQGKYQQSPQQNTTHGYMSGGATGSPASGAQTNVIEKFPFSTDENASDVGDLTQARFGIGAGQSSTTHGYTSGGRVPPDNYGRDTIDKFPFATDANATDVGNLVGARSLNAGQSSDTNGYASGGYKDPSPAGDNYLNTIDKFPFSTDANATDVGDLTDGRRGFAGSSSRTHGYHAGGNSPGAVNIIDKFSFSVDGNATDVGNLTVVIDNSSATQG